MLKDHANYIKLYFWGIACDLVVIG